MEMKLLEIDNYRVIIKEGTIKYIETHGLF